MPLSRRLSQGALGGLLILLLTATPAAAQITTNTALPVTQGQGIFRGQDDPNSGGTTWLVAPGLQYVTRRFVIEGAVQVPAVQDVNGTALEQDVITTLSLRINI